MLVSTDLSIDESKEEKSLSALVRIQNAMLKLDIIVA